MIRFLLSRKTYPLICLGLSIVGNALYRGPFQDQKSLIFPISCAILTLAFIIAEKAAAEGNRRDLLSPDLVFLLMFFVFHFSYIVLYSLGISDYNKEVFYNPDTVPRAIFFCVFCLNAFLLGYGRPVGYPNKMSVSDGRAKVARVLFLSKILILTALLMFWLPIIFLGREAFSDYELLINIGVASPLGRFYWLGQYLGVVAVILYCTCNGFLFKKVLHGPFTLLMFFYLGSFLLVGDRGGFIYMGICPVLAYNLFQKRINTRNFLSIILCILIAFPIIAFARTRSIFNPIRMFGEYSEERGRSFIVDALDELGSTLKTVTITMHFVPERYEYWWGSSYIYSLSLVIPSIKGTRSQVGSPGAWLTEIAFGDLEKTHGRGGSIAMESYRNFGIAGGAFFFLLLGFGVKKAYLAFTKKTSLLTAVLFFSIMAALSLWIRNTSAIFPRTIIWSLFVLVVSSWIASLNLRKRRLALPQK